MAGENLARLVRDRAVRLTCNLARDRRQMGDPAGADALLDLADEVRAIPIGAPENG